MPGVIAEAVDLLDAGACRAFLVRRWHPAGPRCPGCGVALQGRQAQTFAGGGRVHCNGCGLWFTYRTGSPGHRSPANDRQVALFELLSAAGCPVAAIAAACRVSDDTVRAWRRRAAEAS